eukprot:TRINITY_DN58842_c0_g1_i1.p1 TRINITY_DN58842_c0_g1~~TRINITY_DN58842_c0_g1_i1.p1  ORF type:complete len:176 (-),score=48.03 TRINITY_DN58842_c0_g1_i1:352-879(-)
MGGASSKAGPSKTVPTSTHLKRAKTESKFWDLQAEGKVPMGLALDSYGTPFNALSTAHCGKHREDKERCFRSRKLDPLNMQAWYPHCGESFEMESACTVAVIEEIDKRCRSQLDSAASKVSAAKGDVAQDAAARTSMKSVGDCVLKLAKMQKSVTVQFDAAAARERYYMSKRLME